MKKIYVIALLLIFTVINAEGGIFKNPALHIYTDNVENRFEVGDEAKIFVELLTDFDLPNGESEIAMIGKIIGFPPIELKATQINKNFFSFISPILKITDVGERYFQVQLKVRSKKTANRIKKAIKANDINIRDNTIARNATTDEYVRSEYQREIDRITNLNTALMLKLDSLFAPMGEPKELSIRVVAKRDDSVSVLVSQENLTISEGAAGSYTLKLSSRPISDVIVRVSADTNDVDLNGSQDNQVELIFTPDNFDRAQTIRVGIPSNPTQTGPANFEISHEAFSIDNRFNRLVIPTVKVIEGAELATINLVNISSSTTEGNIVEVKATLSFPANSTVIVPFIICGTAEYGTDHNMTDGEFIFNPGTTEASIFITIFQDQDDTEMNEDVTVQLVSPATNAKIGERTEHMITIQGI